MSSDRGPFSRGYAFSLGIAGRQDGRQLLDNPYRTLGNVQAYGVARADRLAAEWEAGWQQADEEIAQGKRRERE